MLATLINALKVLIARLSSDSSFIFSASMSNFLFSHPLLIPTFFHAVPILASYLEFFFFKCSLRFSHSKLVTEDRLFTVFPVSLAFLLFGSLSSIVISSFLSLSPLSVLLLPDGGLRP